MNESKSYKCKDERYACVCKKTCRKCYTLNNPEQIVEYIPLDSSDIYELPNSRDVNYKPKSKACNDIAFYHQFDFDSVKLGNLFI